MSHPHAPKMGDFPQFMSWLFVREIQPKKKKKKPTTLIIQTAASAVTFSLPITLPLPLPSTQRCYCFDSCFACRFGACCVWRVCFALFANSANQLSLSFSLLLSLSLSFALLQLIINLCVLTCFCCTHLTDALFAFNPEPHDKKKKTSSFL